MNYSKIKQSFGKFGKIGNKNYFVSTIGSIHI